MNVADEAGVVVEAVARVWPDVTEAVPEPGWLEFESTVLVRLRALEAALTGAPVNMERIDEAQRAVVAAFEQYPRPTPGWPRPSPTCLRGESGPADRTSRERPAVSGTWRSRFTTEQTAQPRGRISPRTGSAVAGAS